MKLSDAQKGAAMTERGEECPACKGLDYGQLGADHVCPACQGTGHKPTDAPRKVVHKGELVKALKWALNMLELSNESARGFKFGWTKFFAIKAFLATPTPPSASTEGAK